MVYSNEQKKEMVEYGVEKFNLDHEFLNWLIDEFNIIYQKILEERIELNEEFKEILKQRE